MKEKLENLIEVRCSDMLPNGIRRYEERITTEMPSEDKLVLSRAIYNAYKLGLLTAIGIAGLTGEVAGLYNLFSD